MADLNREGEYDGLLADLHELDWGELPAVGEAAAAITTLQARVRELEAALRDVQRECDHCAPVADAALSDAPAANGGDND